MARLSIKVDIHSDTVCPWCYLGKKSLDSAIATFRARHPGVDFDLVWRPYILHPTAKASSYPKGSSISAVLGPRAGPIFERIAATGAEYGINFRWEGLTGNSRDSHKLILLAAEQDAAAAATGEKRRDRRLSIATIMRNSCKMEQD
ncbi:DSBA-like thioredoxin domain-containing protein [Lasiosphaeria miniovina]|uniref:DSBA-like thioredoxin domain-containing protein n=1 Tax=Lasiosphaeria miniovina TaxID=1954250 RepID=A0AA40DQN6_9PEZI|nr:DSBA-like thioredoxin domain-containing protein [Lasiosphaeria miniovina]KAK0709717.1 DSBA-like thioredoxin domain-containing protein [Lasiosphaeria miniovina]